MYNELIDYFSEFMTPERVGLFREVLDKRTRYLTVVLEDIFQTQNASAVVRTCDCFGVQDLHVVENRNRFKVNVNVALGATQWLNLSKYSADGNNTQMAFDALRAKGYRIVATSPHANGVELPDFDLTKGKAALVFGTEREGVSDFVMKNADEYLKIPMQGFTESFNISVSVAIILFHLTTMLRQSHVNWQLSEADKQQIMLDWMRNSIKRSDLLEKEFLKKNSFA